MTDNNKIQANLTEQNLSKKNGKTFFYIKFPNGEVIQGDEFALGLYRMCNDGDKVKMLEPVPSYEEYLALESDSLAKNEGEEIIAELEAENAQLKELLKEYKDITAIALLYTKDDKEFEKAKNIRERIDEVLNERR